MNEIPENEDMLSRAAGRYGLKEDISRIHKDMMTEIKRPRAVPMLRRVMAVAASILFLMMGTAGYIYLSNSNEKLFNQQFVPYSSSQTRGEAEQNKIDTLFINAYNLIQSNQPQTAIPQLQSIVDDSSKHLQNDAEYYLGLAYLNNNDPQNAYAIFKRIRENPSHLYRDEVSRWFLFKLRLLTWKGK